MVHDQEFALRLQSIIETAIDGIITIDRHGIIETINDAACKLFDYDREELLGKNVSFLMPEPDRSMHNRYLSRYLETRHAKIIGIGREVKGKKKDGSLFPFRLAVSEVILNDRIIFTGIVHDLTNTKKAQEQLRELNNQLEEKISQRTEELEIAINKLLSTNRKLENSEVELIKALEKEKQLNDLKSRFVSIASHEFRTPLSTILSSAALISKYTDTDQQEKREKHINKIKSAVQNLTGVLNDFLDLTKLEEGKVILEKRDLDLNELMEEIQSELSGIIKNNQFLVTEIPPQMKLHTDGRILKNILFNLLSNAIKYSEEGEIKVKAVQDEEYLCISVEDNGMGIPLSQQKNLFERFFRASNVENIQGTGLGLSIIKRYVELLSGSVDFESELNKGSIFSVKIPQKHGENTGY